ncbi:MAG: recombinase family protein [Chloroflexota bacterium]|nr:recombinase family protein [Chloroflexota bacterium]
MRAIGYFRESPARDRSVAEQNKAFLDHCTREGYEVASTFVDASGSNGHAPGFRQLLAYVRGQDADLVVVVSDIGALGTGHKDATCCFFQLEGLGARVEPLTGSADVIGDIVTLWSAQDTGASLGDRVRAAMRRKAVKGEVLGRPPYGYKVGGRRRLELIPEEAVVVRYIFRLYLHEGLGIRLIARRLNQEAIRTRRGGNWSMVSIRDLLRNRVYLGTYSRFGVKVPGSHTALVSADDFRAVQDRLSARRTSHAPRVSSQFLLSGLAYCGYCGNKLIGVSRKQSWKRRSGERVSNSYRYYQCESRTNQSVCSYHTCRADELEAHVRARLVAVFASGDGFPQGDDAAVVVEAQQHDRGRLLGRLRALDHRIEGYIDAVAKGRMTREQLRKLSLAAASDRLEVEDIIEAADLRISSYVDAPQRRCARERAITQLLDAWDETTFADRYAGLREAVDRVTVSDDDDIVVVLRA